MDSQTDLSGQILQQWTATTAHFSLTKKEMFLLAAALVLIVLLVGQVPVPYFNVSHILLLTLFTFLGKGFFPATKDTPLYFALISGVLMTLYYPIFQVLLIYFLLIGFMKVLKVL